MDDEENDPDSKESIELGFTSYSVQILAGYENSSFEDHDYDGAGSEEKVGSCIPLTVPGCLFSNAKDSLTKLVRMNKMVTCLWGDTERSSILQKLILSNHWYIYSFNDGSKNTWVLIQDHIIRSPHDNNNNMPLALFYSTSNPEDEDATSASNETAFVSDSTYTEDLLFEAGELPHPIVQLEEYFMQKGSASKEDYLECEFGQNDDGILGKDSTDHIQQMKELYLVCFSMKQKHPMRHCGPDKNHKSEIETLGSS